jgi:plastocyanin
MNKFSTKFFVIIGLVCIICVAAISFKMGTSSQMVTNPTTNTTTSDTSTSTTKASTVTTKTTTSHVAVNHVYIKLVNQAFSPSGITVPAGTMVTWTNEDQTPYTIRANHIGPTSPALAKGQSYSYTFSIKGTYAYYSVGYETMTGVIAVN